MRAHLLALPVALGACGGHTQSSPTGPAAADLADAGVEVGWETDCSTGTCGANPKTYLFCTDPNDSMHFHFGGRSCVCENKTRCGECDPNAPCQCALDVAAWCLH